MEFILSEGYKIRSDQLVDEILQATGINLIDKYCFYPPNKVQVSDIAVAGHEVEIQAIVDVHEPNNLYFPKDYIAAREAESEDKASAIPGWSTWTEEQALAWYTTNVIDLIDAIPDINGLSPTAYANNAQAIAAQMQDICNAQALVILNLARMVIAMRNKLWPNLEGS